MRCSNVGSLEMLPVVTAGGVDDLGVSAEVVISASATALNAATPVVAMKIPLAILFMILSRNEGTAADAPLFLRFLAELLLANARALHLSQRRFNSTPSLRLDCVPLVLEIPSLLSGMGQSFVALCLAQFACVLLDFHRLHVGTLHVYWRWRAYGTDAERCQ
jgi:hypothetical protein